MQQSLFQKEYICPACGTSIRHLEGYNSYIICNECYTPIMQAKQFINQVSSTDYSLLEIKFVKWLINNNHIDKDDYINVFEPMSKQYNKYLMDFYDDSLFDIVIFSKSGKKILCNEKVSYQTAKEICSREDTKFVNSFAGFVISGTYKNIVKGDDFDI